MPSSATGLSSATVAALETVAQAAYLRQPFVGGGLVAAARAVFSAEVMRGE
ncbi:hypothetical protein AAHS21_23720 [Mycobacterium sp. 050272]|uniref:hypothetical protein n=1 Tax=Mycobacterium sp. 050272 TaxID=3142488 RepID=UPI0031994387